VTACPPLRALTCSGCGLSTSVEHNVVSVSCSGCTKRFQDFAATCKSRLVSHIERRPGNALNIEIGQAIDRCALKRPAHWPESMGALRWLSSGGSCLVFGNCSCDCPGMRDDGEGRYWRKAKP
jgi:hypothetical protein